MYFPSNISQLKLKWERCLKIQVLTAMGREAFTEQNPTGHSWPICFYLEIYLDLDEKTDKFRKRSGFTPFPSLS